jgi:hypothetical protein
MDNSLNRAETKKKDFRLFILLLLCSLAVAPTVLFFSDPAQIASQFAIASVFLAVAFFSKRNPVRNYLWRVFYAFFVFDFALAIRTLSLTLLGEYGPSSSTAIGQLSNLVTDTISIVVPIIILTKASVRLCRLST